MTLWTENPPEYPMHLNVINIFIFNKTSGIIHVASSMIILPNNDSLILLDSKIEKK